MTADLPSAAQHKALTPEVTWAQRSSTSDSAKNFIYLTISAPDVSKSSIKLDVQPTFVNFSGYSDSKKAEYAVKLEFFGEIDPSASHVNHSSRAVEIKLQKKELKEEYWPRLLKDKAKQHYLKTDFDKWVDEDEQDGAADEDLMGGAGGMDEGMMGGMGGGMGGMPGMGGMGGMGGAGGMGGLDFSKLGGMMGGEGGAGGMDMAKLQEMMAGAGGAGMGGMPGGEDEDDDEMPDLEDEEGEASSSAGKSSAKIEEVE